MRCSCLLASGLTRSWLGGLITPPSPLFLISMRSTQFCLRYYFLWWFFHPWTLDFSELCHLLKTLAPPFGCKVKALFFGDLHLRRIQPAFLTERFPFPFSVPLQLSSSGGGVLLTAAWVDAVPTSFRLHGTWLTFFVSFKLVLQILLKVHR